MLAPGFAYNQEFDLDLPVLSWIQHFADGKAGYAVGRLAFDVYLDAFPFQTLSKGFINHAAEDAVSAGVQITRGFDEFCTIGVGWATPSSTTFGPGLDDETLIETSYKFHLSKNFSITPDVQVIFKPASNPSESSIWIVGVRANFTFFRNG